MTDMLRFGKRLWSNEDGATAIEYGLLAALVAVAIIGALTMVSGELNNTFTTVEGRLATANAPAPVTPAP